MSIARIIIDADPMVYRAAFAAETTYNMLVWETADGELDSANVKGDCRALLRELESSGAVLLSREQEKVLADPKVVTFAIWSQYDAMRDKCAEALGVKEYAEELYLSTSANFRYQLATIRPYKADRPPKPHYYKVARDFMTQELGAIECHEFEADDMVSIRMHEAAAQGTKAVLCTIDKDLDQIPGLHYDYKNHVLYDIQRDDALICLYSQLLSGDPTDNIPGLKGLGPVKSTRKIQEWVAELGAVDAVELWTRSVKLYETYGGVPGYTGPLTPREQAIEIMRLVYLQTYPGELWHPPDETTPWTI